MKRLVMMMGFLTLMILLSSFNVSALDFYWAQIGSPGNVDDGTGYGGVYYAYSIAKTEVTTGQYVEFLNAVAGIDTYGLYSTAMGGSTYYSGIARTGSGILGNPYTYSVNSGWADNPVVYVSWYDALRFINWIHNGQPVGSQDSTTTEYGAYDMSQGSSPARLQGAMFWLPSRDEWYKAAFYDPANGIYYDYATGTDTQPAQNEPASDTGNSANYYTMADAYAVGSPYYSTPVGAYDESVSPYGTYDQNGNVYEWTEEVKYTDKRVICGGSWSSEGFAMKSNSIGIDEPDSERFYTGFRLAGTYAVPEPSAVLLFIFGVCVIRSKIRKK